MCFIFTVFDLVNNLKPFCEVFYLLLTVGLRYSIPELDADFIEVEVLQQGLDGFGAHSRLERFSVLAFRVSVFLLAEQLAGFQWALARVGYDIFLEIDNLLQVGGFHCQKVSEPIRYGLEEPYMHNRCRQIDMSHSLSSDPTMRNFDPASVANYSLKLSTFVLAAGTLPVAFGPEDSLTKQAVLLRPICTVVDGLGLSYLTKRPAANIIRTGQ